MKMPALKKTILFSIFLHAAGAAILYALVLPSRSLLTPGELKSSVEVIAGSPKNTSRPESSPSTPLKPTTTHASTSADLGSSPTASAPATSSGSSGVENTYLLDVQNRIRSQTTYPLSVRRRGISGHVEIRVVITSQGSIARVEHLTAGAPAELNQLAEEAAKKAAPFAAPPSAHEMSLVVPFEFRLN